MDNTKNPQSSLPNHSSSDPDFSEEPVTIPVTRTPSPAKRHSDDQANDSPQPDTAPQAVVRVLSPRGVEYVFMTIALIVGASGLSSVGIALVNSKTDFGVLEFPASVLIISVPVFAWLFFRLKKAEVNNPALRFEPSKRRSTQFIQILTFIITFFTLIGLASAIIAKVGGQFNGSIIRVIWDALIILLVAGGILAYYWHDEHRKEE